MLFRQSITPLLLLINTIYFQNHARVSLSVETKSASEMNTFVTFWITVEMVQMNKTAPIPLALMADSDVTIPLDVSMLEGSVMALRTAPILQMNRLTVHVNLVDWVSLLVTMVIVLIKLGNVMVGNNVQMGRMRQSVRKLFVDHINSDVQMSLHALTQIGYVTGRQIVIGEKRKGTVLTKLVDLTNSNVEIQASVSGQTRCVTLTRTVIITMKKTTARMLLADLTNSNVEIQASV